MNELDECSRWHETYGGEAEEGDEGDGEDDGDVTPAPPSGGVNGGAAGYEASHLTRRKMAPVRSRRRGVGVGGGGGVGGGAEGGVNGMGDVG